MSFLVKKTTPRTYIIHSQGNKSTLKNKVIKFNLFINPPVITKSKLK